MSQAAAHRLETNPLPARPHPALTGLVDAYTGYHQRLSAPGVHRGLPSSVVTVVFAFEEPVDAGWMNAPGTRGRYWTLASGLHTEPAEIRHLGCQSGIQLGLTAEGARRLLGFPMSELGAVIVDLADIWGTAACSWQLRLWEQHSWEQRYRVLDQLLINQLGRYDPAEETAARPELMRSWDRIQATGGKAPIASIAREVGWSRRHLTASFRAEFGLSPKQLARVARFERSKAGLLARRQLADVAADCGYADQAHLSREWRAMAGYSPREWQRVELPFLQDLDVAAGQAV